MVFDHKKQPKLIQTVALGMEIQHEAGALGERRIDAELAVHVQGHLSANRQAEAVAQGEVTDLHKRFEQIVALLFRDSVTRVRHQELVDMGATLLVFKPDRSACRRIFGRILQQMEQDVGDILLIDLGTHV